LKRIAEALLEREVLDGDEVKLLISGEILPARHTNGGGGESGKPQPAVRPEPGKGGLPGLLGGERPQPA